MTKEVYTVLGIVSGVALLLSIVYWAGRFFFAGALQSWLEFERKASKLEKVMEGKVGNGNEEEKEETA